jgi:hypothetical protein
MINLYPKLDCARCAASTMHRCLGAQATARGRLGYECSVCCSVQSVKAPVEPPVPLVEMAEMAEREVQRLRDKGWTQPDFANALKQLVGDEDDPEAEIRRLGAALLGQERATDNVRAELDDALMDLQQMGVEFADATAVIATLRAELQSERDRVGRLLTSDRLIRAELRRLTTPPERRRWAGI